MPPLAKLLIIAGAVLMASGLLMLAAPRIPWLGRLPGDIHIEGKGGSFYFPAVTCIIISIVLTIVLNLFFRGR